MLPLKNAGNIDVQLKLKVILTFTFLIRLGLWVSLCDILCSDYGMLSQDRLIYFTCLFNGFQHYGFFVCFFFSIVFIFTFSSNFFPVTPCLFWCYVFNVSSEFPPPFNVSFSPWYFHVTSLCVIVFHIVTYSTTMLTTTSLLHLKNCHWELERNRPLLSPLKHMGARNIKRGIQTYIKPSIP